MAAPTLLDAALLTPALLLGLLGAWLGFGRLLVARPMRWLIPLLGAGLAALPAVLVLAAAGSRPALLDLAGKAATAAAGAAAFVLTIVLLAMFMRTLRERVAVWTAVRRPPIAGRVAGALVGAACGLLAAVALAAAYDALRPASADNQARPPQSVALHLMRDATRAVGDRLWAMGDDLAAYFTPAPRERRR